MRRRVKGRKEPPRKNQNVIGPALLKMRLKKGWSQEQAAVKAQCAGLDFTRQMIANMEIRRRGVSDRRLVDLVRLYGCSFDELFPDQYRVVKKGDGKKPSR